MTDAPPVQAQAMRAVLGLIGGAEQAGRWVYREASIGYVAQAAGCGWETARRAWHAIRQVAGWWSVHPQTARDLGAPVRSLEPGRLYGQHLLVDAQIAEAARQVVPPVRRTASGGWIDLDVIERPGGRRVARCPWHDDQRPSALLHTNPGGRSGPGVCLVCTAESGGPLRFFWVRDAGGGYRARPARGSGAGPGSAAPSYGSETGTIYSSCTPDQGADGHQDTGHQTRLLGSLGAYQMDLRESRSADLGLLAILRRADAIGVRESQIETLEAQAMRWHHSAEDDHRAYVPELYVGVDAAEATRWRVFVLRDGRVVRRPCGWRPGAASHVLVDLDGFEAWPVGSATLAAAGERLARWASAHPSLSGEVAVVRTSPGGVQVVFGLREPLADARAWWRTREAHVLAGELDDRALAEVHAAEFAGGHADRCVHAAGRMMRRPGPRITKDGLPYVARLVFAGIGCAEAWEAT